MTKIEKTESYGAYRELLGSLREVADVHLCAERGIVDEIDLAEGLRNLFHLLSAATDLYLEGDALRPSFTKIVSPTRKLMGDNPDAIYHFARIRGDRSYRVTGRRGAECYLSFTVHGRGADGKLGPAAEPVLADVNDRGLQIDADGRFELILSAKEHPGNWIRLGHDAASLIVRHYYEEEGTPAADPEPRVQLRIEALDEVPLRPPLTDADLADRLRDVNAFVRGATIDGVDFSAPIPFVSRIPNELPAPMVFSRAGQDAWGAVDIAYSMGPFALADDEVLVMRGRIPDCAFANVVLWNKQMQCLEYRDRRISLNRKQIDFEPDGSYRIVIAHRDPGVPNWLDTEGHREGTIFWRILLPTETPEKPECRVLPFAQISR